MQTIVSFDKFSKQLTFRRDLEKMSWIRLKNVMDEKVLRIVSYVYETFQNNLYF